MVAVDKFQLESMDDFVEGVQLVMSTLCHNLIIIIRRKTTGTAENPTRHQSSLCDIQITDK